MSTAQIFALQRRTAKPTPSGTAFSTEPDHITITRNADGTHNVRIVGEYAEDIGIAIEALECTLERAMSQAHPRAAAAIIDFPPRRTA